MRHARAARSRRGRPTVAPAVAVVIVVLWTIACGGESLTGSAGADVGDDGDAPLDGVADTLGEVSIDALDVTEDADPGDVVEIGRDATDAGDLVVSDIDTGDEDAAGAEIDADADIADGAPDGADGSGADAPDAADWADEDSDAGDDSADVGPPPLFDMAMIADPSTADCTFINRRTAIRGLTTYDIWDVSFMSWEVNEGVLTPIRIRGFASKPAGEAHGLPGVVNVHGLGGFAEPSSALGPAALLGYFAVAVTGPGGGTEDAATRSEGRPASYESGYRIFDTVTDPRGSWLWGHTVAAMRAMTCLTTRDEVDTTRLGMTGFSAGAIATLIASSVDDRIVASVPLSGTGAWARSAEASASWFHALLTESGLDTSSLEWTTLLAELDPLYRVSGARAHIMMVNGTTDEFFPLTSHADTFGAIAPSVERRTSFVGNFDHGCYLLTGGESADAIAERATWHGEGAQRMWFHHFFGTDSRYASLPGQPTMSVTNAGGLSLVTVTADPGAGGLSVERVRFWWSGDSALTFLNVELDSLGGGVYGEVVLVPYDPSTIWFADIEYRTSGLIPERFSLSTVPHIPDGHVPAARGITSCLP